MKKLISLGVVTAMVASMASAVFATKDVSGDINNLKAYVLDGDAVSTVGLKPVSEGTHDVNGVKFNKAIYLEGRNTDSKKIVFGLSSSCVFGTATSKPSAQEIFRASTGSAVKKANEGSFTNRGVTVTTGKIKVNTGAGEYSGACGVTVKFTNTSVKDQFAAYTITLTDAQGKTRAVNLVTKSSALDKDDVSDADVDTTDESYREFADGASLKNGYAIFTSTLKEMAGKGNYKFTGANGVNVLASVSQATVKEGKTEYNVTLSTDSALEDRYNANGNGKVMKLSCPFLPLENRKINIDCDHQKVVDLLGSDFTDKIVNGSIKRLYVYPINQAGYDSLADASGNDGLINTDSVINASVADSKIVFSIPKNVTDVMVSLKELDTEKLPVIPGVSVGTTSSVANEVAAPIIANEVVSIDNTPAVVSAPVLATAPAATNAGQQNTGASDVVVLAIALAAISMAAAGVVASKKF